MNIIVLGPPGAGKGTQCKTLANKINVPHISTGDLLRQNVTQGSALGKEAKSYMEKGALVPDTLVNQMLEQRFMQDNVKDGFILDGYPRNLSQAKSLDTMLAKAKVPISVVFYLDSSVPVIVTRLTGRRVCKSCGANFHVKNMPPKINGVCDHCKGELYQRTDDKVDTIKNRLKVYRNEVSSLIDFYTQQHKLTRVPADDEAEVVLNKIIALLKNDPLKV